MSRRRVFELTQELNRLYDAEEKKAREILSLNHKLSEAYLRLRNLIPGAFDTPHAPTAEQIWEVTEKALQRLVEKAHAAETQS